MTKARILWIEEEANDLLLDFTKHFLRNGYVLEVVYSPDEAEKGIEGNAYDLIILDIRINPGLENEWVKMHLAGEKRLGLSLLKKMIDKDHGFKDKVVIFSNERYTDLKADLVRCGIPYERFLRKKSAKVPEQLENFIAKFIKIQNGQPG